MLPETDRRAEPAWSGKNGPPQLLRRIFDPLPEGRDTPACGSSDLEVSRQAVAGLRVEQGPAGQEPATPASGQPLRPAAVLLPFRDGPRGVELVLTQRSSRLKHHPGQIALPGGKMEPEDRDATAAALREAQEEIGLDPAQVRILGGLPPHETVTGFSMAPVAGWISGPFDPVPEAGEVAEVFSVPLTHLADPGHFRLERRRWRGGWRGYWVAPFGPYYIWGATARVLKVLADRIAADPAKTGSILAGNADEDHG